ncbi:MAG: hypothetical protein ACTHOD_08345 [Motilibacteraceae bacterium]
MARRGFLPFVAGLILLAAVLGLGAGALLGETSTRTPDALPPVPSTSATPTPTPTPADVTATPEATTAAAGSRVYVRGTVTGADPGTPMVLQRQQDGGWTDFPAHTSVNKDGSYSIWFMTSRTGEGSWRMAVPSTGQTSAPFTVTIS